ncbi:MAG: type IV pilus assembly protein PilM [Kiritimatiellae bacterium]|nr:type IV pilus assembly protein PilM [Kiritimatiellia bacterium]
MLKTDRILALDIGASGLKMAEFRALRSGGIELVHYAIGSLGMDVQSDADRSAYIVTTVRELMREKGIKPGPALISVSGQSVFSRFVKLPPVDREKVYQIILYEAQQNVPFPIEEVVWDYQLIGGAEGQLDVMLAAIKAEIIENMTDAVEAAGLHTDLVDVAPAALYNAVRYNYADLSGCTLVIDVGARSTDLIFIEEGRIFTRSIPVAGNAITQQIMREFDLSFADAEEMKRAHAFVSFGGAYEGPPSEVADKVSKSVRMVMTRMHAEINRSINFYRSQQGGGRPALILLTGGSSVIPYTDTFMKDKLKVDVDYLNPFRNVAVHESIAAEEIARHAHLLGEVVGLGLRRVLSCPIELNLMPRKVVAEKAFKRKEPFFLMAGVCLVLSVAVWCGYFFKMAQLAQERLAGVTGRVQILEVIETRLQGTEQGITEVSSKTDQLTGLIRKRTEWLKVLAGIHAALPEGMWLTAVVPLREAAAAEEGQPGGAGTPEGAGWVIRQVEVSGLGYLDKVTSAVPIRDFRDKLRASELFTDETEIRLQPAPKEDDYAREFKIMIVLEEPIRP